MIPEEMDLGSKMPFGKHKGQKLEYVESEYLVWLFGLKWVMLFLPHLRRGVMQELKKRKKYLSQEQREQVRQAWKEQQDGG